MPMFRLTINKTVELENNTGTLKKLSLNDMPNNQSKLSNVSGSSLPPGLIKCNILKGLHPLLHFSLSNAKFIVIYV